MVSLRTQIHTMPDSLVSVCVHFVRCRARPHGKEGATTVAHPTSNAVGLQRRQQTATQQQMPRTPGTTTGPRQHGARVAVSCVLVLVLAAVLVVLAVHPARWSPAPRHQQQRQHQQGPLLQQQKQHRVRQPPCHRHHQRWRLVSRTSALPLAAKSRWRISSSSSSTRAAPLSTPTAARDT